MGKQNVIIQTGVVVESLPNVMFRVELDNNGIVILCYASGKLKQNFIKILVGDKVVVEISPYDLTKGRITKRL